MNYTTNKSEGSNVSKIDSVEVSTVAKYGLLGEPCSVNEEVFDASSQHINLKICNIPKKNLRVETYQRPLDRKKIANIKNAWNPKICDPITVFAKKLKNGKIDNLIVDGQHRVCAYPSDTIRCRVIEDGHPIIHYLLANDSDTQSSLPKEAVVWNVKQALDDGIRDGYQFNKFPMIYETVDVMNSIEGFECCSSFTKTKNFGAKYGKLYLQWRDNVYNKLTIKFARESKTKKGDPLPLEVQAKRNSVALKVWEDTLEIMVSTFGSEAFTKSKFGGEFWPAVQEYLFAHKKMKYNVADVIDMFSKAPFRPKGSREDIEPIGNNLKAWDKARRHYITGRVQGDYVALIKWVENLYKKQF
jgi:hypothetical protein